MKKIKILFIAFISLIIFSCTEDEGHKVDVNKLVTSFENETERFIMESLTGIDSAYSTRVMITNITPKDLTCIVEVNAASTAVEGTHFNIVNKTITISSGYISGDMEITVLDDGFADALDAIPTKTVVIDIVSADVNIAGDAQITIEIGKNPIQGTPIIDEGFESVTGELPTGWIGVDMDGNVSQCGTGSESWIVTNAASFGGSYSVVSCSWTSPFVADNWLILPAVDLKTYNKVKFVAKSTSSGFPNNCDVYISTTTNDVSAFTTQLYDGTAISSSDWQSITVNIPATYDNSTVYIAFRDDSDGDQLFVDNIKIEVVD